MDKVQNHHRAKNRSSTYCYQKMSTSKPEVGQDCKGNGSLLPLLNLLRLGANFSLIQPRLTYQPWRKSWRNKEDFNYLVSYLRVRVLALFSRSLQAVQSFKMNVRVAIVAI